MNGVQVVGGSNPLTPTLDFANGSIFASIKSSSFCAADCCNSLRVAVSLMNLSY
jgi:hypothetical protein